MKLFSLFRLKKKNRRHSDDMTVNQNSVTREDGVLRVVTSVVISQRFSCEQQPSLEEHTDAGSQ